MAETTEEAKEKQKIGQSKILTFIGLFFLVYLINCTVIYFYLKQRYDKEMTKLRAAADSIQQAMSDSIAEDSLDEIVSLDTTAADTPMVTVSTDTIDTVYTVETIDTVIIDTLIQITEAVPVTDSIAAEDYNKRARQLVKIVNKMKPKSTANIFARLDDAFVVQVLMRMNERNAAKVMSEMPPARAARLSKMIMDNI